MSRVAITEAVLLENLPGEDPDGIARYAQEYDVEVLKRGTVEKAVIYDAEVGGSTLSNPLRTDDGGMPRWTGDLGWVDEGSYDLLVAGQTIPFEAISGGAVAVALKYAGERDYVDPIKDYGAVGDEAADDSKPLQEALTEAIAERAPLAITGKFGTTKKIEGVGDYVEIFGYGRHRSRIVPEKSTYDALVIGPGEEGSGNFPSGVARDFAIAGGNESITASGAGKGNGTSAFRLNGLRHYDVQRVTVYGKHDIAFHVMGNSWGTTFYKARAEMESCRLGLYLPASTASEGAGEDCDFYSCNLAGEVAAIMIEQGKNYRFIGGQLTGSRQATTNQDDRGIVTLNRNYLTGTTGTYDIEKILVQMAFEYFKRCWAIRTYKQVSLTLECSFNPSADATALGLFKGSAHAASYIEARNCNYDSTWAANDAGMIVREGANSDSGWTEFGAHGTYTNATGERNAKWDAPSVKANVPRRWGRTDGITTATPGLLTKVEGGAIKVSFDNGSTWKTVTVT